MSEINLLRSYPRAKRKLYKPRSLDPDNIRAARRFGRAYFDGKREEGYGGYRYDGRWVPIAQDIVAHFGLKPGDRVLEVGTGSGFLTACLQSLGGKVTSYEIDADLSASAGERLAGLGLEGADLVVGDIFDADLADESFDVIAITGSMPKGAQSLERLLAPGGRLFVIKGTEPVMCATLVSRSEDGELLRKGLCETLLPPLQNAPKSEAFQF